MAFVIGFEWHDMYFRFDFTTLNWKLFLLSFHGDNMKIQG